MTASEQQIVGLTYCKRYHLQEARQALQQLFAYFGGIETLVRPGQRVLLKPNLLAAAAPVEAVTTHPVIIKALTELIQEVGGLVLIGDSPGDDQQEEAHRVSGLQKVMAETGAEMLLFKGVKETWVKGFRERIIPLAAELEQVDLVINVAKLKTHALVGLTAAVKNVFGCVVGNQKKRYHREYPLPLAFSRLLIDVYLAVKPAFSIIDAVVAMEGTGPRRGKARRLGLLMASPNAVALDSVAAEITGFRPEQVTTVAVARELKLPGSNLAEIQIKGLTIEECRINDFDQGPAASGKVSRLITNFPLAWFRNMIYARRPYPSVNSILCNGCGVCAKNCPVQVIDFSTGIPDLDLNECIRCYCCQELCAQGAIELSER